MSYLPSKPGSGPGPGSPTQLDWPAVVLVDRDSTYIEVLVRRLATVLPAEVHGFTSSQAALSAVSAAKLPAVRPVLVLADAESCRDLLAARERANESRDLVLRRLVVESWDIRPDLQSGRPYRLMPVSQLVAWFKQRLTASPYDQKQNQLELLLAIDLGWPSHAAWVGQHLAMAVASGQDVYYLPLMPTFRMSLVQTPGAGPNLTALLLQLKNGESPGSQSIGHYLEPHATGYWQYRPPENCDDLLRAEALELRALVDLARQKPVNGKALLLIDCCGLLMHQVVALAVTADTVAAHFSGSETWADQSGQRELASVLARLPNRCTILEMEDTVHAT